MAKTCCVLFAYIEGGYTMGFFSEMDMEQRVEIDPFADTDGLSAPTEELSVPATFDPVDTGAETSSTVCDSPTLKVDQADNRDANAAVTVEPEKKTDEDAEDVKRKAHDEAEAKRKAEWEAEQEANKAAEQAQLDRIAAMSDQEVMTASMQRISADTERLTRRNMKECVSEHIQALCLSDRKFAERTMHPRKSMIHCIWYIYRKAQEYAEQEMKNNGLKPGPNVTYGCDVPDNLCYQWAEDYFNDPNAKEDHQEEEKFVPKPYVGRSKPTSKPTAKSKPKKQATKPTADKKSVEQKPEPAKAADVGQMTLGDFGMMGASA